MSTDQSQVTGGHGGDDSAGEEEFTTTQLSINTTSTDELLDEIDGLLENNAEEFVRSYVQKGGQ
ncbi:ubiquitin-like protein Pup [Corynebacterium sp. c8Ua_181]|uniref:Prokaryotic ubiquitin-like protein Pup n=1 Tax=Corynebacterium curieae TaxID=2913500 RepID=A0A9X3RSC5_9CORY|nr:ubiquitin-like protein Pup [Corynebacterium curieae]MCZ9305947.1 ubiquitin-like protein Pup [Corynebacterium curieae]MDV2423488.1 ubiquitin-like protein Pup [Corynebacterium curieae]